MVIHASAREGAMSVSDRLKRAMEHETALEREVATLRARVVTLEAELKTMTPTREVIQVYDAHHAHIRTLRALLAEAAPKCVQCGGIATAVGGLFSAQSFWCDQHRRSASLDYDLGARIKAASEETP
jgi:hypothetical protein